MKTSKSLVLAPAVAVAVSGVFAVPAVASTSTAPDSPPAQGESEKPEAAVESASVTQSDIADKDKGIRFSGSGFAGDKSASVIVTGTDGTKYKADAALTVNDKGEVNGSYFFTTTGGATVPLGEYTLILVGNDTNIESTEVSFTVVPDSESPSPTPSDTASAAPSETPAETEAPSETSEPPSAEELKPEIGEITAAVDAVDEKAFQEKGIELTGQGFSADLRTTVTVSAQPENGAGPKTISAHMTTDQDGRLAFAVKGAPAGDAATAPERSESGVPFETAGEPGTYTVKVSAEGTEKVTQTTFNVTAAAGEEQDPPAQSDPPESTAPSAAPSEAPTDAPTEAPTDAPSEAPSDAPTEAPADAPSEAPTDAPSEAPTDAPSETTPPDRAPEAADRSEAADEQQPAPKLTIDPLEIAAAEFGKGGVTVTGENFTPGQKVTMVVNHAQGKVKQYTAEVTADDKGVAAFRVRALTTPVLGQYNVTLHPSDAAADSDEALHGSFTVITTGSSVGDETTGETHTDTSGGTDLPRTGAELTGLAMGAGLLVIGAAAVIVTRRRTAGGSGPADI